MPIRKKVARVLRGAARRLDPPPPPVKRPAKTPAVKVPRKPRESPAQVSAAMLAASGSEPGTRKASMFFDAYPRFMETSVTAAVASRLNMRYEAIFAENRSILDGARVLDIASHDGRWTLAALASGAASVVGIEARPDLVESAKQNLEQYGFADRASFVVGDVHEVLNAQRFDVDVVLCLGFLYHTLRYNELFTGIRRAGPEYVVIDTQARSMVLNKLPIVYLVQEPSIQQGQAVSDAYTFGDHVQTGRPNLAGVSLMMDSYGYDIDHISDWAGLIRDNPDEPGVNDYAGQHRMTMRYRRRGEN